MTHCPHTADVQAYLDGDLPPAATRAFREHLEDCAACAAEMALAARVLAMLERAPLHAPAPALTERILGRVLPSRVRRRRWMRALGWAYAASVAAVLAAAAAWAVQPAGQAVLSTLSVDASKRLFGAAMFLVESLSFAILNLSAGARAAELVLDRFAPFARALGAVLGQSVVLWTLAAAAATCVAVLWWMRPRRHAAHREIRHVALVL
jgi:predicted anti-sigma-YlaC factor YlaD